MKIRLWITSHEILISNREIPIFAITWACFPHAFRDQGPRRAGRSPPSEHGAALPGNPRWRKGKMPPRPLGEESKGDTVILLEYFLNIYHDSWLSYIYLLIYILLYVGLPQITIGYCYVRWIRLVYLVYFGLLLQVDGHPWSVLVGLIWFWLKQVPLWLDDIFSGVDFPTLIRQS